VEKFLFGLYIVTENSLALFYACCFRGTISWSEIMARLSLGAQSDVFKVVSVRWETCTVGCVTYSLCFGDDTSQLEFGSRTLAKTLIVLHLFRCVFLSLCRNERFDLLV
jgi:hypothetical protein